MWRHARDTVCSALRTSSFRRPVSWSLPLPRVPSHTQSQSASLLCRRARRYTASAGAGRGQGDEPSLSRGPRALVAIEVTDSGRGGSAAGTGYGITGMRERAALLDGDFSACPRPGGGFRVTTRLPVPAPAR